MKKERLIQPNKMKKKVRCGETIHKDELWKKVMEKRNNEEYTV